MFIGRQQEKQLIKKILSKDQASILVVYGRRRIGKTALIEQSLIGQPYLKLEGKEGQSKAAQLQHCLFLLSRHLKDPLIAKLKLKSWTEFFYLIADKQISILYLEELQWLANYKNELLSDLKEVWDNHFKKNPKFRLILCGSAPSFMITNVIRSKALYNRAQYSIPLTQFSLKETHAFLGKNKSQHEVMEAFLTVGGIPEYLKYLKDESSVFTSLMKSSFTKGGFFVEEFEKIFTSSLSENSHYRKIIEYLAKRKFASRQQIIDHFNLASGGNVSQLLNDLEQCQFINTQSPYFVNTDSKLVRYTIADNYLQFFYKFIKPRIKEIQSSGFKNYNQIIPLTVYRQWLGYAFERFCVSHHRLLADILGFKDVDYKSGSYFKRELLNSDFQIDLIFDRKDRVITICEIKYHDSLLTKSVVREFNTKLEKLKVSPKQSLQRVLISATHVPISIRSEFDRVITLEDIFARMD